MSIELVREKLRTDSKSKVAKEMVFGWAVHYFDEEDLEEDCDFEV